PRPRHCHRPERGRDPGHLPRVGRLWPRLSLSELERELSKHLVVRLTNATTAMDICVVHLRRAMGEGGVEKQREQCRARLSWAMRHLPKEPKAHVVILGDFNEGHPVGSPEQALSPPFVQPSRRDERPPKGTSSVLDKRTGSRITGERIAVTSSQG